MHNNQTLVNISFRTITKILGVHRLRSGLPQEPEDLVISVLVDGNVGAVAELSSPEGLLHLARGYPSKVLELALHAVVAELALEHVAISFVDHALSALLIHLEVTIVYFVSLGIVEYTLTHSLAVLNSADVALSS